MGDNDLRCKLIKRIDKLLTLHENDRNKKDLQFISSHRIPEFRHRRGRVARKFVRRKSQETREYVRKRNILIGTFKSRDMKFRQNKHILEGPGSETMFATCDDRNDTAIFDIASKLNNPLNFCKHDKGKVNITESVVSSSFRTQCPSWLEYCESVESRENADGNYSHLKEWDMFLTVYEGVRLSNYFDTVGSDRRPVKHLQQIQVFYPSKSMMEPFIRFVHFMEWMGCDAAGGAKIVPPLGFVHLYARHPPLVPITQKIINGNKGKAIIPVFGDNQCTESNEGIKTYSLSESFECVNSSNALLLQQQDSIENKNNSTLNQKFWDSVHSKTPTKFKGYRKSTEEHISLFSKEFPYQSWSVPNIVNNNDIDLNVWSSFNCFPQDNQNLTSHAVIYQHAGHPTRIRIIPPSFALKFVDLLRRLKRTEFPSTSFSCPKFMLHRQIIVRDEVLDENSIPYSWVEHTAGSFVVIWPNSLYFGFATGFGVTESGPFYLDRCSVSSVLFDIACFKLTCPMRDQKSGDKNEARLKWIKENTPSSFYNSYISKKTRVSKHPLLLPTENVNYILSPHNNPIPIYARKLRCGTLEDELLLRNFYSSESNINDHCMLYNKVLKTCRYGNDKEHTVCKQSEKFIINDNLN